MNKSISPEQEKQSEWEKNFDEKFVYDDKRRGNTIWKETFRLGTNDIKEIKAFIREVESNTRETAFLEFSANSQDFIDEVSRRSVTKEWQRIGQMIVEEMNIAHSEGQPTSRLTSLLVRMRGKVEGKEDEVMSPACRYHVELFSHRNKKCKHFTRPKK